MSDPMDGPKTDNLTDPMTDPVTDLLSISMTPQNYQLSIFGLEYIQSLMWRHFEEKIREGPEGCLVKSARSSHLQLEDLESNNREALTEEEKVNRAQRSGLVLC